jgi:hypothetical protein
MFGLRFLISLSVGTLFRSPTTTTNHHLFTIPCSSFIPSSQIKTDIVEQSSASSLFCWLAKLAWQWRGCLAFFVATPHHATPPWY